MTWEIRLLPLRELQLYASIPIVFDVSSVLEVRPVKGGLGGLQLEEVALKTSYQKDYDNIGGLETGPLTWALEFDMNNWGIFVAFEHDVPIGGAMVAFNTAGVNMLEGRRDLAVLWDLRVHPEHRGKGIGHALFRTAAEWSKARECRKLKIETQNTNVPACHFYQRQGCTLGSVHRFGYDAYSAVSHEAMLLWYKDLTFETE